MTLTSGACLGPYAIVAPLGRGGMGEVYEATDTRVGRRVAVKVLGADLVALRPERLERFEREARAIARLNHPHICTLYDVGEQDGHTFIVMEYLEGETLTSRLRTGPLALADALHCAITLADAVGFAHQAGIVHRDIKPSNIILTPNGPKLLDFGLAKLIDPSLPSTTDFGDAPTDETLTRDNVIVGTLAYMSPEQLEGAPADTRSDVFSLGMVIYEMFTGRRAALDAPPLHVLQPAASEELSRIVHTCLKKQPHERWQGAADLARALTAVSTTSGTVASTVRSRSRTGALIAAGAVLLIIVTFGASRMGWWTTRSETGGSLVVLPCKVPNEDAQSQAYCDGLAETLAATMMPLTAIHGLQMTSPFEVRNRKIASAGDARKAFGATMILEGTVTRSAETVRITYALVDTRTAKQIDAFTATASTDDPFALQDRIAQWALTALSVSLNEVERRALTRRTINTPAAYELYLRGRGYLAEYGKPASVDTAIDLFQRAIELEPADPLIHASLGVASWRKYETAHDPIWVERAGKACAEAARLNPDLPDANVCLGTVRQGTGEFVAAIDAFNRALERDPANDEAVLGLGRAQEMLGRFADAEQTYRRAVNLRPQYWAAHTRLGLFYRNRVRYREAADEYERAAELTPDNPQALFVLGGLYLYLGRYDAAIDKFKRSIELGPTTSAYSNWGMTYFRMRRFGEAVAKLEEARTLQPTNYRTLSNLARAYYWNGQRDEAASECETVVRLGLREIQVNPKDADAHLIVAECLARSGDAAAAESHVRESGVSRSSDPHSMFFVAIIFNHLGQRASAVEWLRSAVSAGLPPAELQAWADVDNLRPLLKNRQT